MSFGNLGSLGAGFGRLGGNAAGFHSPPSGFAWVVYTDPDTGQDRIVTYTDPDTGAVRPVMASLS